MPTEVAVEDLQPVDVTEREGRFETRIIEEARRPFDPAAETLLRARAFKLGETDWGLILVSNHLATDGWGARLLLDELSSAYRALSEGSAPDLPPLAIQYGDYAIWEVDRLESGELDAQRDYWLRRLDGAPSQLRLPFDGPPSRSLETESIKISFSTELSESVRAVSRSHGVTSYITLLAGFEMLLQEITGQNDIVVGTIMSRRTRSETESLIGNFGNNLLLRTVLDGNPSGSEVIQRTAATMREALAHSDVSLEIVAQAAPIPAFHVMFIVRDGNFEERLALGDIAVAPASASPGISTVDLVLDLTDGTRGISGYFEFRTARFARETMERLAAGFERAMTRLVQQLQTPGERQAAATG
jgi:hypothetical protein